MSRILLAEDDVANRKLMIEILQGAGHTVVAVANGQQAVALATEQLPDLIVMDVNMPDMDGLTATRILRSQPQTAAVPVLALTAMAMRGDDERILAAGCDAYLAKPVSYKDLLRVLDELSAERGPLTSAEGA